MARAIDVIAISPQSNGWNMITNARVSKPNPSLAGGVYVDGVVDAVQNHAGSPGAVLGTGMNADLYTPGIEAV